MILARLDIEKLKKIINTNDLLAYKGFWQEIVRRHVSNYFEPCKIDMLHIYVSPSVANLISTFLTGNDLVFAFPSIDKNLADDECYIDESHVLKRI